MKNKRKNNAVIFILLVAAFAAGLYIGAGFYSNEVAQTIYETTRGTQAAQAVDNSGFTPSNVTILGTHITIEAGCKAIAFDVTEDQAYSIERATEGVIGPRPLTHDILKDVLENYDFKVLSVRIERWGDEIYYARMFVQQYDKVLDIDLRPSDAIAISLRTGDRLLINQTMLEERGTDSC